MHADLAFALPSPEVAPTDTIAAVLRPWSGRRHRLPVAVRPPARVDGGHARRLADALDAAAVRTGTFCTYAPDPRAPIAWQVAAANEPTATSRDFTD